MTPDEKNDFESLLYALRYWLPDEGVIDRYRPSNDPALKAHFDKWHEHTALCQRIQQRLSREGNEK